MAVVIRHTVNKPIMYSIRGLKADKLSNDLFQAIQSEKQKVILIESETIDWLESLSSLQADVILCKGFKPSKHFTKKLKRK